MTKLYWWSRYGDFDPGEGILPHMGQVIARYRKAAGYKTQDDFAIVANVRTRSIAEWETSFMLADQNRRVFLAKLLRIPPALLGLDWRLIHYQDNQGTCNPEKPLEQEQATEQWEEESYYHYEDTLLLAYGWKYGGKLLSIADRFERRLRKLEQVVQRVPTAEKDAWLWLLGHYYRLATEITRNRGQSEEYQRLVLRQHDKGVNIANEIDDPELQAVFLIGRADTYEEQKHPTQAHVAAREALQVAEKLNKRTPLYGNIQVITASILLPATMSDPTLLKTIWQAQDKALNIVWNGKLEPDRSFMKLRLAGVHHERAKTFLEAHSLLPERGYLKEAEHEMRLAWEDFGPDIAEWALYFHLTEARLYKAQGELERSAQEGLEALKVARAIDSQRKEGEIVALYQDLSSAGTSNAYVRSLGVQLELF
jgi:hypothetical protein